MKIFIWIKTKLENKDYFILNWLQWGMDKCGPQSDEISCLRAFAKLKFVIMWMKNVLYKKVKNLQLGTSLWIFF